ncbi:unnamed protein product [Trichogramma brassicae]|uniref:Uncharacterized protein n=1 Tax=Trichogramma brassicae TaxID=86971 RepID=A0A6H5ILQ4_9HYME|nr:unnamed protein product [Trichogramma brassicae]
MQRKARTYRLSTISLRGRVIMIARTLRSTVLQAVHVLHRLDEYAAGPSDHRLLQSAVAHPRHRLRRRERRSGRHQGMDGRDPGLLRHAQHRQVHPGLSQDVAAGRRAQGLSAPHGPQAVRD